MQQRCKTIGKSIPRLGAEERVRGLPIFCADRFPRGALILKIFRSTRAHARILNLDLDAASRVPGVVRIFTARDIPGKNLTGIINKDRPLLVPDKARCVGDALALVAAETEEAAQRALRLIRVEYEDLPAVLDPEEALKEDAPAIHDKGNLLFVRRIQKGDATQALKGCHRVVERTYRTPFLEHAYLEPDAGFGYPDEEGRLVILASTQNPHYDQAEVASLLGIEAGRVRIIQAATGGGFGSKLDLNVQGFIGLALYHLKRPVCCLYSREEVFLATSKRHPLTLTLTTGVDREGKLQALKARILCETGAYASYGIAVAGRAAVHVTGPYEIPHVEVESLCVYTNHPVAGAMRGFGAPQAAFAYESQMDLLAEAMGIDPLEIRLRNALRPGAQTATQQVLNHSVGIIPCLEALRSHWQEAKAWRSASTPSYDRRGVGIGAMWYGIGNTGVQNPSTAQVELNQDGRIILYTGCADIGQGSTTVLCQIAAEILGLDPRDIEPRVADTLETTNAGATSASRQTYISGNAVKEAASKLAEVICTEAVSLLKTPKEFLTLEGGSVVDARDPDRRASFAKIYQRLFKKGIPRRWDGYFDPATSPLDSETGRGDPYATYAFASHLALVRVDVLTGEVRVEKVIAAHDVGRAIHPESVVGQICGGVAMGVGFALMEEFVPGETKSLKEYHIPTWADMPKVVPIIVESEEPSGPFGAKGVGEPALIPTAPAILNAVADALGIRLESLPANLERVLEASAASGHFKA